MSKFKEGLKKGSEYLNNRCQVLSSKINHDFDGYLLQRLSTCLEIKVKNQKNRETLFRTALC